MKQRAQRRLYAWVALVLLVACAAYGINDAGVAFAQRSIHGVSAISRDQIITRARAWLNPMVLYSTGVGADGYKHDCSGYVSWAWGLSGPGLDTVGLEASSVSEPISKDQLLPGDILDNGLSGMIGHVVIFAGWAKDKSGNVDYSHYNAYEESPDVSDPQYHGGAVYVTGIDYPYWSGDAYRNDYKPFRYVGIADGGQVSGGGDISGRVVAGDTQQGLANAQVVLSGTTTATTYTDGNGQYTFHSVPAGAATITATAGGYMQLTTDAVVQPNTSVRAADIYLYPLCMAASASASVGSAVTSVQSAVFTDVTQSMIGLLSPSGACDVPTTPSGSTPPPGPATSPTAGVPQGVSCSTPTLSSPSDGSAYQQSDSITISWYTNCPQSYAELSGGPYGTLNFGGWQSTTSIAIGQMWPGTYTWHVMGMDSSGRQTGWSASWTFTINSNPPTPTPVPPTPTPVPSAGCSTPSLASPGNGTSYAQSTSITISWYTNCPQSYAELSGGPYGTLNFGGWKSATYIVIGQMWPGTYTWHVMGMDSSGRQTGWSSSWTFTIN